MSNLAAVKLWGRTIGAVALMPGERTASFEYDPDFARSGIEPAPLTVPLSTRVYRFPALPHETFQGLPGLLADSLPDRFGHALIDAWLATQGRTPDSFDAVERLCYTGSRGMGALEFEPAAGPQARRSERLHMDELVRLASEVMAHRHELQASFADPERTEALRDILRVGTSAGGARAKAVIAWNPDTGEVRSGQVPADPGFEHWLLKFDGVAANRDRELADPAGYGAIEYAYSLMARAAGIDMTACRLLEEGGRRHFMTRRFDRPDASGKLHMLTLGAMAHLDYNQAGAHSYEQALLVMRRLQLPMASLEQLFRRMAFNIVARNQDDHVKNIAFLMDRHGRWSLAPAYDLTYAYQPDGRWTSAHQLTLNGKRDDFELADFKACAEVASLRRGFAEECLAEVIGAVSRWSEFAEAAGVAASQRQAIAAVFRLNLLGAR